VRGPASAAEASREESEERPRRRLSAPAAVACALALACMAFVLVRERAPHAPPTGTGDVVVPVRAEPTPVRAEPAPVVRAAAASVSDAGVSDAGGHAHGRQRARAGGARGARGSREKSGAGARVRGAVGGAEPKVDVAFYTQYQKDVIEQKLPYPIIKGFFNQTLEWFGAGERASSAAEGVWVTQETQTEEFRRRQRWLDGGAGNCGVLRALRERGVDAMGAELSDIHASPCAPFAREGLCVQSPLHELPFPDRTFDVVFSTEVLEHVPPALANASVRELVRVSRRHVFTTISLRPSALDKEAIRKGLPPKVHLTVRPREFWEELFRGAGCRFHARAFEAFQRYDPKTAQAISPHFFPFVCHEDPPPVWHKQH